MNKIETLDSKIKHFEFMSNTEIMNYMNNDVAEEWGNMSSGTPLTRKNALAIANDFLKKQGSKFEVVDVIIYDDDDDYTWLFEEVNRTC